MYHRSHFNTYDCRFKQSLDSYHLFLQRRTYTQNTSPLFRFEQLCSSSPTPPHHASSLLRLQPNVILLQCTNSQPLIQPSSCHTYATSKITLFRLFNTLNCIFQKKGVTTIPFCTSCQRARTHHHADVPSIKKKRHKARPVLPNASQHKTR